MGEEKNKEGVACSGSCQEFLKVLNPVLDGQATKEEEAYFYKHIEKCSHCLEHYNLEKGVLESIKAKLASNKKCCPSRLLASIKDKIKGL